MRVNTALVHVEHSYEVEDKSVAEIRRKLKELIVGVTQGSAVEQEEENSSELILIDTDLEGFRYLLVRMPRLVRPRIQLSPREQEIVRMVAKGHPNKVIADVLNISAWTVCTHLRRIFLKLGVGSRAAMVAQLLETGILAGHQWSSSDHL
jgi:DNA-binding CsgD family transcriptional regulator